MTYNIEQYIQLHNIHGASFSFDNQRLSLIADITGIPEVWSVTLDIQQRLSTHMSKLTAQRECAISATFSPTANKVIIASDTNGREKFQLHLFDADNATLQPISLQQEATYLFFGVWSSHGEEIIYSSNERDSRCFDIYEFSLANDEKRLLWSDGHANYAVSCSLDNSQIVISRFQSKYRNELALLDRKTSRLSVVTPEIEDQRALYLLPAWSQDQQGFYLLSNYQRQFLSLAYLHLTQKKMTYLLDEPWGVELLALDHTSSYMALVFNKDGYSHLQVFDIARGWEEKQELFGSVLPAGVILEVAWSKDGQYLAITLTTATAPSSIWIWDRQRDMLWDVFQHLVDPGFRQTFVQPQLIHYPTFDQRQVPAFLYLNRDTPDQKVPMIIELHGGPEAQSRPAFQPFYQYLVAHGYGVLAPNARGSTGYGYDYQSLDDGRLRMDAVTDVQYAARWLHEAGIAANNRIALMGTSYGGFLVLAALARYPALWAAGIDISGIANFITFLGALGPRRRKIREMEYGDLDKDRDFLIELSPLSSAHRIVAPLLVVHGANDPRVPVSESDQIVAALQTHGAAVEYLRFEDEGHGFTKLDHTIETYKRIASFLRQYLGE